jgi:leader peptidase (prepilin peptidase)/N-methyltransferase
MLLAGNWVGYLLKILIVVLVFCIGATIFSYFNIVIEELPKEEEEKPLNERLTKGRSICPHCGHSWRVKESLPILSWLIYKRKCVYCFEKISPRHTLIEALGGVLAVASVLYYHVSLGALTVFLVFSILAIIAIIDMDTRYIPSELNLILAVLGIVSIWTLPGTAFIERLIGIFSVPVLLILVTRIVPGGFGGGDIRMAAASGILLGWKGNVSAFIIALLLGCIYSIYLLVIKKKGKKDSFAFGPFFSVGIAVSLYADIGVALMNALIDFALRIVN